MQRIAPVLLCVILGGTVLAQASSVEGKPQAPTPTGRNQDRPALVFLVAGQSNAGGCGVISRKMHEKLGRHKRRPLVPGSTAPEVGLSVDAADYTHSYIWIPKKGFQRANPKTHLRPIELNGNWHGMELPVIRELEKRFPKNDIFVVKYGPGATTLHRDWNPKQLNGKRPCYATWLGYYRDAMAQLSKEYPEVRVVGLYWDQGESDGIEGKQIEYAANLKNFITTVRRDTGVPNLKLFLRKHIFNWTNINTVIAAQETVCKDDPQCYLLDIDLGDRGKNYKAWAYSPGNGHVSSKGFIALTRKLFDGPLRNATVESFDICSQAQEANVMGLPLWRQAKASVEAAIPKASKDPTRPVYHFRPPAQWMNDICGAIYYNGYYHAFYQYNPFSGDSWGVHNSIWAHARSKGLVHWEELPWAFLPIKKRGEQRCNSGCVTLDANGKPMIFYTFVPTKGKRHQWGLKPLDDDLIQWKRVPNEPLMAAGKNGIPIDVNGGWSDPFVFRSEGRTFVTFKSCGGLVCEAKNKELTQWEYAGKLEGVTGECPNFFPLENKWVLIRSTHPISYVVGDFDAKNIAFRASGSAGTMDYGFGKNPPKDRSWTRGLYGTNAFEDQKGRRILLGWICGFKPKRGWNGCMSMPRILTLDKEQRLIQSPATELHKLRGRHRSINTMKLMSKEERLKDVNGDTMEILADFVAGDAKAFGLKVRQSTDGKSAVTIRYTKGNLNVAGTDVPIKLVSGKLRLHVFIDKSVLEVFINGGVTSVSRVEYPGENDLGVSVFAENGSVTMKSLNAWEMKSIW